MKILILTQYFPPEVGAPQNRLFELALRLQKEGAEISVLTAMPNYPQMEIHPSYKGKCFCKNKMEEITVYRSWIYVSKNRDVISRLINYFSFVFSSLFFGLFRIKKHDFILCESPPLFLGISAYIIKLFKRSKLIFNVSDLWPESAEKLGIITNRFFLNTATKLEEFLYRKSHFITGQTQGIVKNISSRFPDKKVFWLKNGVDTRFYNSASTYNDWRKKNNFNSTDFLLFYGGIIGIAQALETILYAAKELQNKPEIKFILLGSGPEKEKLQAIQKNHKINNVYFFDAVTKEKMPEIINSIDIAIIPLKKIELFKGAIPSKIFENLAMKKPLLLGVEGEAKTLFIEDGNAGLAFEPENQLDLKNKILQLYNHPEIVKQLGINGYNYVLKNFSRDTIAKDFWQFITHNN